MPPPRRLGGNDDTKHLDPCFCSISRKLSMCDACWSRCNRLVLCVKSRKKLSVEMTSRCFVVGCSKMDQVGVSFYHFFQIGGTTKEMDTRFWMGQMTASNVQQCFLCQLHRGQLAPWMGAACSPGRLMQLSLFCQKCRYTLRNEAGFSS